MSNELHTDDLDHAIALLTNDVTAHVIEWSREAKTLQDSITFKMRVDALRVLIDLKRTPPELGGAPLADTVRQLGRNLAAIDTRQENHASDLMNMSDRLGALGERLELVRQGGVEVATASKLINHNVDALASDVRRNSSELENHCHRLANLEQVTRLLAVEKRSTDD